MTEADYVRELNLHPEATAVADEAVRAFPDSALLWLLRGHAYWQSPADDGSAEREAGRSFERAIALAPTMQAALVALADYRDGIRDDAEGAAELYRRVEALRHTPPA